MYVLFHDHEAADYSRVIAASEHQDRLKKMAQNEGSASAWSHVTRLSNPDRPETLLANGKDHEEMFRIEWVEIC